MGLLDQYEPEDISSGLLQFGLMASKKRPFLGLLAGLAAADKSVGARKQTEADMRKAALDEEMKRAQLEAFRQQQAQQAAALQKQQGIEEAYRSAFRSPQQQAMAANGGPTNAAAAAIPNMRPAVDQQALIEGLMKIDPVAATQMLQQRPKTQVLKPGEQVFTEDGKPLFGVPDKPAELPANVREFQFGQSNPEFNQWLHGMKRAGATNIGLPKIEVKMGEGIAAQVGPMMKDARAQAESGLRLVDSAQRVLSAAEANNLYAGPLANTRLKLAQVGDMLGVAGGNTQEKIANTRNVIRGMAEQAVSARAQLGGQAQISNSEQELLNKATSGDIAELTAGEIVQIARLNDRLGRTLYGNYERQLSTMKNRPELQGIADFYAVPPLPGAKVKRFNPETGKIE